MTKLSNPHIFNNLYGWAMSQKLTVKNLRVNQRCFIKDCNEESDQRYFFEVNAQYPEKLHELHNDLTFLPERMKTKEVNKFIANLHYKTE